MVTIYHVNDMWNHVHHRNSDIPQADIRSSLFKK